MKTKPKRLLAVLLSLCLALSIVPITAFAAEIDFLPSGVKKDTLYQNVYYTQVNVTANVSVKDSDGTVIETTEVTKSGDFVEGNVSSDAVKTALASLQTEIETPYKAKGTVTRENGNRQMKFDHFDGGYLYTFTPTSGDSIPFADQDAAKQYFREHPDATGTFTTTVDVHEYQTYDYTYDLTVQENSQPASTITSAAVQNVKINYQPGDAPQATAEVYNADADKYEIAYECWQQFKGNEPVAAWYSDNDAHGSLPTITEFESGEKYVYFLMLKAKNGRTFAATDSGLTVTVNGWTVEQQNISVNLGGQSVYVTGIATITPTMTPISYGHTHSYGTDWKYDSTNHWHECSCGDKTDTTAHSFKWLVDKEATATEKGSKHEECTVCGYKKAAVEIPATGSATQPTADQLNTLTKEIKLTARTSKTAKKNIKVTVNGDVTALKDAGYTVKYKFYRSTKKASKYVALKTKDTNTYTNTIGKKGTKYYYKARVLVYDGDTLVAQTALKQCKYGVRTWTK